MKWTDTALREYLLGASSPEAAERIEARVLDDEELFAALESAEDDLFDASARGQLSAAEQAQFLERFGHQRDRMRFAEALAHRSAATRTAPPARPRWIPLAAAAAVILAAGAVFTQLEAPSSPPGRPASSATGPQAQPPQTAAFGVALTLGTSRAPGSATTITIPSGTTQVRMDVRLDPGDRFDRYSLELRGAGDRTVWSTGDLTASSVNGVLTVSAQAPATALTAGSYELAVRGGNTDLGFVPMTIRWSP